MLDILIYTMILITGFIILNKKYSYGKTILISFIITFFIIFIDIILLAPHRIDRYEMYLNSLF